MCLKKKHIAIALSGSNMMFLYLFTLNYEMKWKEMEFPFITLSVKLMTSLRIQQSSLERIFLSHLPKISIIMCVVISALPVLIITFISAYSYGAWLHSYSQTQNPSRQRPWLPDCPYGPTWLHIHKVTSTLLAKQFCFV